MRQSSTQRPLSPRLSVYRWGAPMVASLFHRASGLLLVLFVPLYLWLLHGMTGSTEEFDEVLRWMHSLPGRVMLWLAGTALVYHVCNGLRFLCLDAGWFETRRMMRLTARLALATALAFSVLLAVLL
ncbi:MAG: succinate dehydrogenase, cytochrome b556 subunit [Zetaproteobacteria bacterium]|nr:MAG: succinate dehydrogenase, cytochrome b556 subunit [Zetaproteobacteria bacterium]